MIYITIDSASQLRDMFRRYDRLDNFSYEGTQILFDYLDEMGVDVELDIIGLCCDYCEMTLDEIVMNYSLDVPDNCDDLRSFIRDYLENETVILGETSTGFVFACF